VLFTAQAALLTGVLFGLVPAPRAMDGAAELRGMRPTTPSSKIAALKIKRIDRRSAE
jgi:hypothetical protein